jgi:hypothetical protein
MRCQVGLACGTEQLGVRERGRGACVTVCADWPHESSRVDIACLLVLLAAAVCAQLSARPDSALRSLSCSADVEHTLGGSPTAGSRQGSPPGSPVRAGSPASPVKPGSPTLSDGCRCHSTERRFVVKGDLLDSTRVQLRLRICEPNGASCLPCSPCSTLPRLPWAPCVLEQCHVVLCVLSRAPPELAPCSMLCSCLHWPASSPAAVQHSCGLLPLRPLLPMLLLTSSVPFTPPHLTSPCPACLPNFICRHLPHC